MRMTVGMLRRIIKEEVIRDLHVKRGRVDEGMWDSIKGAFGGVTEDDKNRYEAHARETEEFGRSIRNAMNDPYGERRRNWSQNLGNPGKHWTGGFAAALGPIMQDINFTDPRADYSAKTLGVDLRSATAGAIEDDIIKDTLQKLYEFEGLLQSKMRDPESARAFKREFGHGHEEPSKHDISDAVDTMGSLKRVVASTIKALEDYPPKRDAITSKFPAKNDAKATKKKRR
jgi:hypothetical protein